MDVALQLVLPIIVGFVLGQWIDGQAHQYPLWTLVLGFGGIVMGFGGLMKRVVQEQQRLAQQPPIKSAQKSAEISGANVPNFLDDPAEHGVTDMGEEI